MKRGRAFVCFRTWVGLGYVDTFSACCLHVSAAATPTIAAHQLLVRHRAGQRGVHGPTSSPATLAQVDPVLTLSAATPSTILGAAW